MCSKARASPHFRLPNTNSVPPRTDTSKHTNGTPVDTWSRDPPINRNVNLHASPGDTSSSSRPPGNPMQIKIPTDSGSRLNEDPVEAESMQSKHNTHLSDPN